MIELNITLRHSNAFYKAYKIFNGVLVIKLMPLSVFCNQNKRACTNTVSHNVLLIELGVFSFGGCRGIISKGLLSPYEFK
ncbi:hypothetical protein ACM31_06220 [Helicobacter pylori]|nr:hypothetical protein ACM31_06220 [Helicobacter pylori]